MWLTVLSVFGSLLTIAASQSCPEDSTLLMRLKPLGQCKDGEDTCPYRITIPPLTIQLPKSFSELEKLARELEHLTQTVNQLKHDCQECKERQRMVWNLRTADIVNAERIQASRGTLNTRERQQDITKREGVVQETTGKSADEDTILSSGTKVMNPTDLERQVWNNQLRKINPSTTRLIDETSGRRKVSNPLQNKRIIESMSKVGKKPLPKAEERTKLSQDGLKASHHGKHKTSGIKVGLGKHTGGNLTKHFRLETIPEISEVTKVSKLDNVEPKQPIQSINDKILGEIQHAADLKERNDRKLRINMTKLTTTHSKLMEDKDEVSDTELKDTIPFISDSINVALETSASVIQHPMFKNKDTESGSGVDSKQVNIVDTVSGLEMLRAPTSDRADVTVNASQINSYLLKIYSENTFKPDIEAGSTSDLPPVITTQTVSQEDQSSRVRLRQINSQTMNINPKSPLKPGAYAEIDTEVDTNPDNTETSKSPVSGISDPKYKLSQLNPQTLDRNSKNTLKPFTDKERDTDMDPVKLTDTPSSVEMPRSPMSFITHSSADKSLINPKRLISSSQNAINPTSETHMDFGKNSNQVNTPETQLETSTAPVPGITDSPAGVSEIDSKTMDRGSGNPGAYSETDEGMDLNPAETGHGLELSKSSHSDATVDASGKNPQSWNGNDDLTKGWPQLEPNLNMTKPVSEPIGNSSVMTANTKTKCVLSDKKTTSSRTDAGKPNLLTTNRKHENKSRVSSISQSSTPALDQESSGILELSGGHPVRAPAVDKESSEILQPSGGDPVRAPAVDQEPSGNPQPSGVHIFRAPVVQQKTNVMSRPSGKPTMRAPSVDQESSGMPHPSGVLPVRDPATDQGISGMLQPSAELSVQANAVEQANEVLPFRAPAVRQKTNVRPKPSGRPIVRVPALNQKSSIKSQPSGILPVRAPAVNRMSSRIPQPSGVLPVRAPDMEEETSGTPQTSGVLPFRAPAVQKKTNVMPRPSGKLTLSVPDVDTESGGILQGSGVLPLKPPALNHKSSGLSQPSWPPAVRLPSVDQEASGISKHRGLLPFRDPAVDQNTSSMTQVTGVLSLTTEQETSSMPHRSGQPSMRPPATEQETSNMPLPTGTILTRDSAVEQEISSMPRPRRLFPVRAPVTGQVPKRFKAQNNITFPKYIKTLGGTHPTRVILAKKPTLKKTYILQSTPGNDSMEAFPKTFGSGQLKNTSRIPGHTMDVSSGIKQDDSKTSPSPQNRSAGTGYGIIQSLTPTAETSSEQKEFNYPTTVATWSMKLMKETKDKHSPMTLFTTTTVETPHNLDHDLVENAKTTPRVKVLDKPEHHRFSNSNLDGASTSSSGKTSDSDLGITELHLDVAGSRKVTVLRPNIQNRAMDPRHGAMDITESTGTIVPVSSSDSTLDRYSPTPLKATESTEVYSGDGQPTYGNNGKSNPVAKDKTEETEATLYKIPSKLTTVEGTKKPLMVDNAGGKGGLEKQLISNCNGKCDLGPSPQPIPNIHTSSADKQDKPAQDCSEITMKNLSSGVYNLTVSENYTFSVACDLNVSGGGWTLIQRRLDGSVSFSRTWDEYKKGFGNLSGEFWLGNDKIHWLTSAKAMVLRIELEDLDGVKEYAQYEHFHVANESQRYRLTIGKYSGTAGNAMQYSKKFNHDQKYFSTPDRDNDQYQSGNCGVFYSSGWWFDACMAANLNGRYYQTRYKGVRNGIFWGTWHNISTESYPTTDRQAFKTVRMMIRPRAG